MREEESIMIFITVKPHIEISYHEQKSDNTNKKVVATKKLMWKQVCVNTRSVYLFEIIFSPLHLPHTRNGPANLVPLQLSQISGPIIVGSIAKYDGRNSSPSSAFPFSVSLSLLMLFTE